MIAFLIGVIGGALELSLLSKLVLALQQQKSGMMALIFLLKLLVLVLTLTLCVIFFRSDLLWCGVGLALVLVGGSFIRFIIALRKQKGA